MSSFHGPFGRLMLLSSGGATAGTPAVRHPVPGLLVLAGLAFLYMPTLLELVEGLWTTSTGAHGPIVLALVIWLFVSKYRAAARDPALQVRSEPRKGWLLLSAGLALCLLGRTQSILPFTVASALPVLLGTVLLLFGTAVARRLWFAFFFLLFLIPLPGSVIDTVTQPLKLAVAWMAEEILHAAGYPTSRSGVSIAIGPYQLFVADACAGLNSFFVLEGLGLFYLNMFRHPSVLRTAMLGALIVPISFASNVVRVLTLAIVTYYWGDEAGQGFLHTFSGMVLFFCALALTLSADGLLRTLADLRNGMRRQRA